MTRLHGWGRRPVLAGTAVVVALLVGGTTVGARAQGERRYVALGDSYTAGPLIPHQVPDRPGCQRSDRNYPHLVGAALGASLVDVSCSGATTADLAAPQRVPGGTNRPQLDAVDPTTDVVTLGVGGNDIGFSGIISGCLAPTPLGRPCQDRFTGPGGDEITRRVAETGAKVGAVLGEIRRRAPAARVYVVGYPAILPEQGFGCWPVMPLAADDVAYLRDKLKELNAMLAAQAAAAHAAYIDTYGPGIGHDACALPGTRWIEPVVPLSPAAPVHPNARGMRGVAAVVAGAIDPTAGSLPPGPVTGLDVEVVPGSR